MTEKREHLLQHELNSYFEKLRSFNSVKKTQNSLVYKGIEKELSRIAEEIEYGFYAPHETLKKKSHYRAVAWNIERGIYVDEILEELKNNTQLNKADLLLLTETDIGMARTKNKNIARDLAVALQYNYCYSNAYINLCKGNSVEGHYEGENLLGLHGNALLSRYPLENWRSVALPNCKDKMKGSEKRLGSQRALIVDICLPYQKVTVVVAHLDAHSSPRQRAGQMELILNHLKNNPYPVLIGGDFNTSTYNARKAVFAFFGFWDKVFRGVDYVIEEHYPYPDRFFEKRLFDTLQKHGFNYRSFNEEGMGTLHYRVADIKGSSMIQEVVPEWCLKILENTLSRHGGKVSLKLDWFAARGLKVADENTPGASGPKVLPQLKSKNIPLSDHDPILVDFVPY